MVAAMLRGAGYKVGLYVSPHLMDIRERVTVNEEMISQQAMAAILAGPVQDRQEDSARTARPSSS